MIEYTLEVEDVEYECEIESPVIIVQGSRTPRAAGSAAFDFAAWDVSWLAMAEGEAV